MSLPEISLFALKPATQAQTSELLLHGRETARRLG
jgi:hypothetical protein